jgi:hypothetical protein
MSDWKNAPLTGEESAHYNVVNRDTIEFLKNRYNKVNRCTVNLFYAFQAELVAHEFFVIRK